MKRKIICVLLVLLTCFAAVAGYKSYKNYKDKIKAEKDAVQAEHEIMRTKSWYAVEMYFDSTVGMKGSLGIARNSGVYREVVFVASESESLGYDDDVIVAWPTEDTERIVYNINLYISDENVDITSFSLQAPITVKDTIENWESVHDMIHGFGESIRNYVTNPGHAPF